MTWKRRLYPCAKSKCGASNREDFGMDLTHLYPEPHPQTAGRVIDGEAVVILAEDSEINVLNSVGSRIFQLADGQHSLASIVDAITNEYNVTPAEAQADVKAFIEALVAQRVLIIQTRA